MAQHQVFLFMSLCAWTGGDTPSPDELLKDFVALDRAYVPALALTKMQKPKPAAKAMRHLTKEWRSFQKRHKHLGRDDKDWADGFTLVDQQIRKALELTQSGQLLPAHEALERVRGILRRVRRKNHIEYYLDHLTDFHDVMEKIVKPNLKRSPKDIGTAEIEKLKVLAKKATSQWNRVRKAKFDPVLFGFDKKKQMKMKKSLEAESVALMKLHRALKGIDKKQIRQAAVAIKPGFAKLFMLFGDFPMKVQVPSFKESSKRQRPALGAGFLLSNRTSAPPSHFVITNVDIRKGSFQRISLYEQVKKVIVSTDRRGLDDNASVEPA